MATVGDIMEELLRRGFELKENKGHVAFSWRGVNLQLGSSQRLGKLMRGRRPRLLFTFVGGDYWQARGTLPRVAEILRGCGLDALEEPTTNGRDPDRMFVGAHIRDDQRVDQWRRTLDAVMALVIADGTTSPSSAREPKTPTDRPSPSTLSSVVRHGWPHPVAQLFHLTRTDGKPRARLDATRVFIEGVTRFLFWVSLADAVSQKPTADTLRGWLERAARPGLGSNTELIGTLTKWSAAHEGLFVQELPALVRSEGWAWLRKYTQERNDRAHHTGFNDAQASHWLDQTKPLLSALLDSLRWLQHYHLGTIEDQRRRRGRFFSTWSPRRGLAQVGEELKLWSPSHVDWPEKVPLLLDVRRQRFLRLDPWFQLDRTSEPSELLWLAGITKGGLGTGKYRHPYRRRLSAGRTNHAHEGGPVQNSTGDVEVHKGVELDEQELSFGDWAAAESWPDAQGVYAVDTSSVEKLRDGQRWLETERYQEPRLLGSGGSSHVYAAWDTRIERWVVLKRLKRVHVPDVRTRRRFEEEARALARLHHPGLVQFHHLLDDEDDVVIELEYIEGETIRERVEREGPLEAGQAAQLAVQVLEVLDYLHGERTLHRDIKPSNVILQPDGRARLIDLGIHKCLDGPSTMTRTGTIGQLGSWHYMAPEQRDMRPHTEQTDLYGVGRLLQFMLTGEDPMPGARATVPPQTPLARVIAQATEIRPEDRYSSAEAMRRAIENAPPPEPPEATLATYRTALTQHDPQAVHVLTRLLQSTLAGVGFTLSATNEIRDA